MGIFDKIRARREEKQVKKNVSWENPAQPVKPASTRGYKQGGFSAGEGTGSHSSGPNKSGNDNYVSPELTRSKETPIKPDAKKVAKKSTFKPKTQEELKSAKVKPNTDSIVKDAKLPGHIEKTPVVEKKSVFDLEDDMHQRGIDKKNAEAKKKADADAKKKAAADVKKKADAAKRAKGSKNTKVVNQEATNKSGYKTHYTADQLERKNAKSGNERAIFNKKNKAAAKSGDIYEIKTSDGKIRRVRKK
jgi:hypothetical protein